jgi:hypothetical protein
MTKPNPMADCRHCGREFLKPVKRAVFCSPRCALASKTRRSESGCWEWTGHLKLNGYGVLSYNGKHQHAHKLALETELGRPLKPGFETCHECDNRACVNPAHLSEGTRSDNMLGAVYRGRLVPDPPRCAGERHGQSKLTEEMVRTIRASSDGAREIAARYGINPKTVWKIRRRESWRHI